MNNKDLFIEANKRELPIINNLSKLKDKTSFHTPGHNSGKLFEKLNLNIINNNLYNYDTTEIHGMDNLLNPRGIIKKSQDNLSDFLGTDKTYYLVNGSTSGIISMILSQVNPKDKVLIQRDSHESVINAIILGDIEPVFLEPNIEKDYFLALNNNLKSLKENLKKDIKAVILTSPNYYGFFWDLKEVRKILDSYDENILLLIDEAHGAHLRINENYKNKSSLYYSDVSVQSFHKSLPSMTQTSVLNINNSKRINKERLEYFLRMNSSSSPSYIFLASLELSYYIIKYYGQNLMKELIVNIAQFKDLIKDNNDFHVFQGIDKDETKIVILIKTPNISGYELMDILREDYNIYLELASTRFVLALSTISNTNEDFLKLANSLNEISKNKEKYFKGDSNIKLNNINYFSYTKEKSFKETFYSDKELIPVNSALGKTLGSTISIYPPGIPIIFLGEKLNKEKIDLLNDLIKSGAEINGIKDGSVEVIKS